MKKSIFKKIGGLFLGLAMGLGVAAGVSTEFLSFKDNNVVYAANELNKEFDLSSSVPTGLTATGGPSKDTNGRGMGKASQDWSLTTTSSFTNVEKIVVNAASNGTLSKMSLSTTVGGANFGSSQGLTAAASTDYTFEGSASSGVVVINAINTQGSKTIWIKTVSIYTTSGSTVTITLNKSSTSIAVGGTETLSATVTPSGTSVSWSSNASSIAQVDSTGKVTGIAAGTATITATAGGSSATCTVTVTGGGGGGGDTGPSYELLSDASKLKSGLKFILLHATSDSIAVGSYNSKNYFNETNSSVSNNVATSSGATVFTLGGSSGSWTISDSSGYYYALNNSTTMARSTTAPTSTNTNYLWSISIADNVATMKSGASSARSLCYNTSSPRFSGYTASGSYPQVRIFAEKVQKTNVNISANDVEMTVGDPDVTPTGLNVTGYTLTSASDAIVSIVSNKIRAVSKGSTTVTISKEADDEHTYTSKTINVKVNENLQPFVSGVTVTPSSNTVVNKSSITASATVSVENDPSATLSKDVTWSQSSTDGGSVTFSSSTTATGVSTTITAVSAGTVTITATSAQTSTVSDSFVLTITKYVVVNSITISPTSVTKTSGYINDKQQLAATVNYEYDLGTNEVEWSSSNYDEIYVDQNGQIEFLANTTSPVTITATSKENTDISSSIQVTASGLQERQNIGGLKNGHKYFILSSENAILTAKAVNTTHADYIDDYTFNQAKNKPFTSTATITTSGGTKEVTAIEGVSDTDLGEYAFTFTNVGENQWKIGNGTNAIGNGDANNGMSMNDATGKVYTCSESSSDGGKAAKDGYFNLESDRYIAYYSDGPDWRTYKNLDNGDPNLYFIEYIAPIEVESVSITDKSVNTIYTTAGVDGNITSLQLSAQVLPGNAKDKTVTWDSSNKTVATVSDSGLVTPIAAGTTTISVTSNSNSSKSDSIEITVKDSNSIKINTPSSTTLKDGESGKFTYSSTGTDFSASTVAWSASPVGYVSFTNPTVDGSYTISCSSTEAVEVTITCLVNEKYSDTLTVEVMKEVIGVSGLTIDNSSKNLSTGDTFTLTATVTPNNASNKTVTFASEDSDIASLSSETAESGTAITVTGGSKSGTTSIKVTADGYISDSETPDLVKYCSVTVHNGVTNISLGDDSKAEITLPTNDTTRQLVATVTPDYATDKSVTWSSSNEFVVSVDSNGNLTTHGKPGTARITVTSNDDSDLSDYCDIIVEMPAVGYGVYTGTDPSPLTNYEKVTVLSGYGEYSSDNWLITIGGNSKSAGYNNKNAKQLGKYSDGTTISDEDYGFAIVSKNQLSNVSKVTFTFNGGSGYADGKLYLLYSSDGENWSLTTLTSGEQGTATETLDDNYVYEFNSQSAYFAVVCVSTASSPSSTAFRFDNVKVMFEGSSQTPSEQFISAVNKIDEITKSNYIESAPLIENATSLYNLLDAEDKALSDVITAKAELDGFIEEQEAYAQGSIDYSEFKSLLDSVSVSDGTEDMETILEMYNELSSHAKEFMSEQDTEKITYFITVLANSSNLNDILLKGNTYTVEGQCKTSGDYLSAKLLWNNLDEDQKLLFSIEHEDMYLRLEAWARANGDYIDSNLNLTSNESNRLPIIKSVANVESTTWIIAVVGVAGLSAIGGYFFYRKRKEI